MKKVLIYLLLLGIGGGLGYSIHGMTVGKYQTINATCTVLNTAVDNNMLSADRIIELGHDTRQKLGESQSAIFQLNEQQIMAASPHSICSQFMVGMSQ